MKLHAALASALWSLSLGASAALVFDQNQTVADTAVSSLGQPLAQSFTAGASNIAGIGAFYTNMPSLFGLRSATVTITLWDALPNAGGTALASGTGTAESNAWVDFFFAPVNVTAGDVYFLTFAATNDQGLALAGSTQNPYAGGQVFAGPTYQPFAANDYAFRTYTETASSPALPEPGSLALAGLAALAAGLAGRRRRPA